MANILKSITNKPATVVVRVVIDAALTYLSRRVAQNTRDQYTGKTEDNKSPDGRNILVSVTLTHTCGTFLTESIKVREFAGGSTASSAGVELANKLIERINNHQRTCMGASIPHRKGVHHDNVIRDDRLTKPKKRETPCEICGEEDLTKYPKWPECEHVRENATTSRKKSVGDKQADAKQQRAKKVVRRPSSKVRRTKDRAAKGQSAMARHVHPRPIKRV